MKKKIVNMFVSFGVRILTSTVLFLTKITKKLLSIQGIDPEINRYASIEEELYKSCEPKRLSDYDDDFNFKTFSLDMKEKFNFKDEELKNIIDLSKLDDGSHNGITDPFENKTNILTDPNVLLVPFDKDPENVSIIQNTLNYHCDMAEFDKLTLEQLHSIKYVCEDMNLEAPKPLLDKIEQRNAEAYIDDFNALCDKDFKVFAHPEDNGFFKKPLVKAKKVTKLKTKSKDKTKKSSKSKDKATKVVSKNKSKKSKG